MVLRPYGILLDGALEIGLEAVVAEGIVQEIRPHTGIPEPWVLSAPFVNAHSHLEYRGFQGSLDGLDYWDWIRELTRRKDGQDPQAIASDCKVAAAENRKAGVGLIGEHTDRLGAAEALAAQDFDAVLFQETITFFEAESPQEKLRAVEAKAAMNRRHYPAAVFLSPHAPHTVDPATLRWLGGRGEPMSIHVAEREFERQLYRDGSGAIADFYRANGVMLPEPASGPIEHLDRNGCLRAPMQIVHGCDLDDSEIALLARRGIGIAHCPRSNLALGCPAAKVRRMLNAGIPVGLGLDSAASSGPIDFFAEMRAAIQVAESIGEPLTGAQIWHMATAGGAESLDRPGWLLAEGWGGPILKIHAPDASSTEDLILGGDPEAIEWLDPTSLPD